MMNITEMILEAAVISSGSVLFIQLINTILFSIYMRGESQPEDQSSDFIGNVVYSIEIYTISFSICLSIYLIVTGNEMAGIFVLIFGFFIRYPLTSILINFVVFLQCKVLKPVYTPLCTKFTKSTKRYMLLEEAGISIYSVYIYEYMLLPNALFLILSGIGLILTYMSLKKLFE